MLLPLNNIALQMPSLTSSNHAIYTPTWNGQHNFINPFQHSYFFYFHSLLSFLFIYFPILIPLYLCFRMNFSIFHDVIYIYMCVYI